MLHVGWIYVQAFWTMRIISAIRCLHWLTSMVTVSATWQSGLILMTMEAIIEAQSTSFFQVHIVVNK